MAVWTVAVRRRAGAGAQPGGPGGPGEPRGFEVVPATAGEAHGVTSEPA